MSIMPTIGVLLALSAMLLTLPIAQPAQAAARVVIRRASQLAEAPAVMAMARPYRLLSTANVIYAKCNEALALTDGQQQFVAKQFADTSVAYMQALDEAFQAYTGTASPKAMVDDYYQYLLEQQTEAATRAVRTVENNGCKDSQIRDIVKYYDDLQALEAAKTTATTPAPTTTPNE